MADNIVEKLNSLLGEKGAGEISKRIANNEKSIAALLKKIGEIQAEKRAEEEARLAAEEAARLKEEAERKAAEEAEKAKQQAEAKKEAEEKAEQKAEAPAPAPEKPAAPARPATFRPETSASRPARPAPQAGGQKTYIPSRPANGAPRPQGARPPFNSQRPQGAGFQRPMGGMRAPVAPPPPPPTQRRDAPKKFEKTYVERRPVNKRALQRQQGADVNDFDEDKSGYRKARFGKKNAKKETQTIKIEHAVVTSKEIPIKELSEKLGISAVEITKRLFKEGVMKTVNESIDYDNAAYIALELGIDLEYKPEKTAEEALFEEHGADESENTITRAPVVTVMGHVDHGKTSLLDKIRSTNVTAGEAGGITQSIGAYTVTFSEGKQITFIDTPGHEAFTAMRARGAKITDIVVLVVAADDGIMPQTVEAINHAKAAEVPIIVAMNKMDKPQAEPDKVKQGLLNHGLVPEEWGGDVIVVPVSAKTGEGIDALLENIYLQAEMNELKANPDRKARGVVIEAKLDKGKGPMASVLVQNGTLRTGDNLISGMTMGRVRAMFDDNGKMVKEAGPSMAVSVLGLEDVPNAGDGIYAVDQALMKKVQEERKTHLRESMVKETQKLSIDDFFKQADADSKKAFNVIIKADVQGSVEALKASLQKLSNEEVEIKILHAAAGAVTESDVMLAESAKAMIIGFNVRPDAKAKTLAERSHVDVRQYRIIYELLDDMEGALKGMLSPKYQEVYMGKAEVKQTFNITGVGTVAGCYVTEGKLVRGGKLRIYRDNIMIVEGGVKQLKRFKDDAKEVTSGMECGCAIDGFNEIKIGDFIECYLIEEVKRA
ncbi:MAG: translation initiation factor IF-2 [Clostridia bacterium]|nr:translation initiation factor IF-2 [Clostridia bacterium]